MTLKVILLYFLIFYYFRMKKSLLMLILLSSVSMVLSDPIPPISPESYWGYVRINGTAVPEGTNITVQVTTSNETVGSVLVGAGGLYTLDVYFDDSNTTIDEGANENDPLIWSINGVSATNPSPGYDKANSGKVNNNFTVEISAGCSIKGDKSPCDGKVDDFELLEYINKWAQEIVGDFDLLDAIKNWATI